MNKSTLTVLIILAVGAAGLAYLKFRTPKEVTLNPESQSQAEMMQTGNDFASLVSSGSPFYCEMNKGEDYLHYWIKNEKVRVESNSEGHMGTMISDTEYIYTWDVAGEQALKMRVPDETTDPTSLPSAPPTLKSEADYKGYEDQGYTVTCRAEDVADSLFVPPSDITFTDPSTMTEGFTGASGSVDMQKLQEMAKQHEGMTPPEN